MSSLKDKVAIVTGASRGIGAEIAIQLGQAGASVVVNYHNSADAAKKVVESIKKNGSKAIAVKADVSKLQDVKDLFAATIKEFGGLDILVNNAGTIGFSSIESTSDEEYDRIINTNLKSVFYCLREASKVIRTNGRIINISGSSTKIGVATLGLYAASKAAVEQLTKSAAHELASKKVTVNVVSPGYTKTDWVTGPLQAMGEAASPLKRIGEPNEVAAVVAFLASGKASWVLGQNIQVNGGFVM